MKSFSIIIGLLGLVAGAPAPQIPSSGAVITPVAQSQYDTWTGAIRYQSAAGKIFKNGKVTDTTTLLTFTYPAASAGKSCTFHFYLPSTGTLSGTGQFDLFSSLAPATKSTSSWPPGNQRNIQLARLQAVTPGEATYVAGFPLTGQKYPCPASGTTAGYELVGVGDTDDIEWTGSSAGAYITYA
jgi:hypothetical protein